jgi:hypothetical protein
MTLSAPRSRRWHKSTFSGGDGDVNCVEVGYWRKSSFSGGSGDGQCVEVALGMDDVAVRDSKSAGGDVLDFPSGAWHSFVGVLAGR